MSWDEIQERLAGAWQLMFGKPDGLRRLDLSIDGFWNSFFAMAVALPPLLLMWVALANERIANGTFSGSRMALVFIYGAIDLAAWVLPLIGLALAARAAGIAERFVPYVVASNWASAIVAWFMLPIAILTTFLPGSEFIDILLLGVFLVTSVMMWRLTNAAIGKGPSVATGVFAAMLVASIATVIIATSLAGIGTPAA